MARTRIVVTVSPGARRTELAGRYGEGWKARVAAAPERGRANAALIDLLARQLGVPTDQVSLVAGRSSRRKVLEVEGLDAGQVDARLQAGV